MPSLPICRRPGRSLAGILLAALLALPASGLLPGMVATGTVLLLPDHAEARATARSSGGYTRPGGFSTRTPTFGSPSPGWRRTPSTSGGYSRPSGSGTGGGGSFPTPSPGDQSVSRRSSGDALSRYRSRQQEQTRRPEAPLGGGAGPGSVDGWGGGGYSGRVPRPDGSGGYGGSQGWYGSRGWSIPRHADWSRPSFGVWNALFLWFMLDSLSDAAHAAWFYNHQNDPGYQSWRAEAERLARDNADLRAKLDQLDSRLARMQGQPRDPDYLPPDVPRDVALAEDAGRRKPDTPLAADDTGAVVPVVLLAGGAGLFVLWRWRRKAAQGSSAMTGTTGGGTMDPVRTATGILRQKMSGTRSTPSRFRVGMSFALDPTPFILAQGVASIPVPAGVTGGDTLVSIAAVGVLEGAGTCLHRLYLPDEAGFFQLHLDASGQPDECRFFGPLDTVTPAGEDEWGLWLNEGEGMIGWPQFQTRDGKLYDRVWSPGTAWVPPQDFVEARQDLNGSRTVSHHMMLYGAVTGAAPPGPRTVYVLVDLTEDAGQAWVAVFAGIDVSPAALSLS